MRRRRCSPCDLADEIEAHLELECQGLQEEGRPGARVKVEATLNAVGFYERFGFHAVCRSVVRRNDIDSRWSSMESAP